MSQRIVQLKVSTFARGVWLVLTMGLATIAADSIIATVRRAAERESTAFELFAPLLAIALAGYLAWFLWWRVVPELRPMGEIQISDEQLVVHSPSFLGEPFRIARRNVVAGVIDKPNGERDQSLTAGAICARTSEGFTIAALVLHSSWPNLAIFLDQALELPGPRLRARLLFPSRVRAVLAQVRDPADALTAFASWNLAPPTEVDLANSGQPRRAKTARLLRFDMLRYSTGASVVGLVFLTAWAGGSPLLGLL